MDHGTRDGKRRRLRAAQRRRTRAKILSHTKTAFAYIKAGKYIFIRPLTFMNESGRTVKDAMRVFGAGEKNVIVVHDDSDIPVGEFKHVTGGGSAGTMGSNPLLNISTPRTSRASASASARHMKCAVKRPAISSSPRSPPPTKRILEKVYKKIRDRYFL